MAAADPRLRRSAQQSEETASEGLGHRLRGMLGHLTGTVQARLHLLQVEIEEEQIRVVSIALFAVAAAVFLGLAVLVLTFFVILLFWDSNRVLATGLIGGAYLAIGIGLALAARARTKVKSALFSASLAELKKDVSALSGHKVP